MKLINLLILIMLPAMTLADEWVWAPDYPEGSQLTDFVGQTGGDAVRLSALRGEHGTLVMFSRSTVW